MVMNFSPSRSSTQGVIGSIECARRRRGSASKLCVQSEPFEVAPGREDQPRLAALARAPERRPRVTQEAPAHSPSMTLGASRRAGAGDEEQSVEAPRRVELGHPARERGQRRQIERKAGARSSSAKGRSATRASLQLERAVGVGTGARPTGTAVSSIVSRIAATAAGVDAEPLGEMRGRPGRSGRRETPARRRRTPCRRRARPSAARAAIGARRGQDQGRGGDRLVAHARA